MFSTYLKHGWLKLARSRGFGREIGTMIAIGFLSLMILGYLLALGFYLNTLLSEVFGVSDTITYLNGLLIYYIVYDFLLRYFLQNVPVMDIVPYLHLPLKKSGMIHFILLKSIFKPINLISLVVFGPFAFTVISESYGNLTAWSWISSLLAISIMLHYLMIIFKKKLDGSPIGILVIFLLSILTIGADYLGWFSLRPVSSQLFNLTLETPWLLTLVFIAGTFLSYTIDFKYFKRNLYIEELEVKTQSEARITPGLSYLSSLGRVGELISLEIRLIVRHKKSKMMLVLSGALLLYGLIFYRDPAMMEELPGFSIFVGVFITGIFMLNYGQMLFSWQGKHFDFIITQDITLKDYIKSKYYLLAGVSVVCFILSIPYVYFGWWVLLCHIAVILFNLGVNIFVLMNFAMWNPKPMDLNKSSMFNYEGIGAAQWLMGIPILVGPYVIYGPLTFTLGQYWALAGIAIVGLIGVIFHQKLIDYTAKRFLAKKYAIASGFRQE